MSCFNLEWHVIIYVKQMITTAWNRTAPHPLIKNKYIVIEWYHNPMFKEKNQIVL